ncbi:unnamed protein product [Prorocentrum cordatum]|uniref:Uncharacterized protein n=1 Tax=Prorocentrum cordatum TaxID=2364126 RepID=A0ABN9U7G8_9DINO|nr:unnamed protein product [Polarella glacialis]
MAAAREDRPRPRGRARQRRTGRRLPPAVGTAGSRLAKRRARRCTGMEEIAAASQDDADLFPRVAYTFHRWLVDSTSMKDDTAGIYVGQLRLLFQDDSRSLLAMASEEYFNIVKSSVPNLRTKGRRATCVRKFIDFWKARGGKMWSRKDGRGWRRVPPGAALYTLKPRGGGRPEEPGGDQAAQPARGAEVSSTHEAAVDGALPEAEAKARRQLAGEADARPEPKGEKRHGLRQRSVGTIKEVPLDGRVSRCQRLGSANQYGCQLRRVLVVQGSGSSDVDGRYLRFRSCSRGRPCYSRAGDHEMYLYWNRAWYIGSAFGSRDPAQAQAQIREAGPPDAVPCEPYPATWRGARRAIADEVPATERDTDGCGNLLNASAASTAKSSPPGNRDRSAGAASEALRRGAPELVRSLLSDAPFGAAARGEGETEPPEAEAAAASSSGGGSSSSSEESAEDSPPAVLAGWSTGGSAPSSGAAAASKGAAADFKEMLRDHVLRPPGGPADVARKLRRMRLCCQDGVAFEKSHLSRMRHRLSRVEMLGAVAELERELRAGGAAAEAQLDGGAHEAQEPSCAPSEVAPARCQPPDHRTAQPGPPALRPRIGLGTGPSGLPGRGSPTATAPSTGPPPRCPSCPTAPSPCSGSSSPARG